MVALSDQHAEQALEMSPAAGPRKGISCAWIPKLTPCSLLNPAACVLQVTRSSFKRFLVNSPLTPVDSADCAPNTAPPSGFGSFHQQYWIDSALLSFSFSCLLSSSKVQCFTVGAIHLRVSIAFSEFQCSEGIGRAQSGLEKLCESVACNNEFKFVHLSHQALLPSRL